MQSSFLSSSNGRLARFSRRAASVPGSLCRRSVMARAQLEVPAPALSLLETAHTHAANLYNLAEDAAIEAAAAITTAAAPAATTGAAAAAVATTAGNTGTGPIDQLANIFEATLKVLDEGLEKAGIPYSYGFAIILLTILVKLATFPLSQKQVQSTVALQALQPRVKELQAKYAGDAETLQLETAKLYRDAGVNPLAGCLPTLATIPVFIGLYKALTQAANDGLLTDAGFFWIPSLGGPTSIAARTAGNGLDWLFPFVDGHPPVGWSTASAYLVLPVALVVVQSVTQRLISPPNTDPSQQTTVAILRFLPFMIGWFSLNVPSGLTLYWLVNTVLSTAQQMYLKSSTKTNVPELTTNAPTATPVQMPVIKAKEERVKKITGKDTNARKRRSDDSTDSEGEDVSSDASPAQKNSRGEKFRALRAREAASKAASLAGVSPSGESVAEKSSSESNPSA